MKTIGDQVQEYRKAKGLNAAQLARLVGTRRQNIEQLEAAGNRIPKYLGSLAAVMGVTLDDMLATAGLAKAQSKTPPGSLPKGAVYEAPDTEEKELLSYWRHLLGKDRRQLLAQIAELAKEREAEKQELFERSGVTAIAERAAHASRRRTETTTVEATAKLRQRSLLDDDASK